MKYKRKKRSGTIKNQGWLDSYIHTTAKKKKPKDPNKHFKIKFLRERPTIEGKISVELSLNSTMNQES